MATQYNIITIRIDMNDYEQMMIKLIAKVKDLHLQLEDTNKKLDETDAIIHKIIILLGKRT